MNRPDRATIHAAMTNKGYVIFDSAKGFDLNIVGIRSVITKANRFDDWLTVSYKDAAHGDWAFYAFACTTDPGLSHLQNLSHRDGTAVLKEGQYRSSHMIRKHQGKYDAICQKAGYTLQTYRDRNQDGTIDRDADKVFTNATGINIHRAGATRRSTQVDRWSAGCQVLADPTDFDVLMTLARRAKEIYGNGFTYTLLNEVDL